MKTAVDEEPLEALIAKARQLFSEVPRPEHFTNHLHCCECAEHDDTLQRHTPGSIGFEELGSPAWDPICFVTDQAFRYYFPAMVRLALEGAGDTEYASQFLSHVILDGPRNRRWEAFSPQERQLVVEVLEALVEYKTEEVGQGFDADRIFQALEIWSDEGE